MNSEISQTTFAALPVRRREILEIFDTALKLYRRYFWVLLGWSALVSVTALASIFSGPLYLLAMPFLYGSTACCVAGAVRGQKVAFKQCWQFSKPRYGAMLGVLLLSYLVFFAIMIALYLAMALLGVLGALALSNAPRPVQIVGIIVGVLALLLFFCVMTTVAFGWLNMVPIVACLEDDKRGTAAMGRSFDLLKGQWARVLGMSLLMGLAVIAVMLIIFGVYGFANISAFREVFGSNFSESRLVGLMSTVGGFISLFFVLWNPAQNLVIAVLYLDLRVRREALDLEWAAYSTAPTPAAPTFEGTPRSLEPSAMAPVLAAPSTFAASPTSFGASPSQTMAQPVEITTQHAEITTPPVEIAAQPAEIAAQPVEITVQPAEITVQPVGIMAPPAEIMAPPVGITVQPSQIAAPPTGMGAIPSQISSSFSASAAPLATGEVEVDTASTDPQNNVAEDFPRANRD